jgi:5'-3' exoribonuclease 2
LHGLAWVMGYYYQGCPSWKWFYPHHYAPFAADFVQYLEESDWSMDYKFDLGKPFRPFDQLMSVFPAASAEHLPEPFRRLMRDADSELLDFYPEEFSVDLNGKKHAWQGIALLPFIDEDRLLSVLEKIYPELSSDHLKLNKRGHDLLFVGERSTAFGFLCSLVDEPEGIWPLDVLLTKGVAGSVRHWEGAHPIGGDIPGMLDSEPTITDNQVIAALYYPLGVSGQESTLRMHFPARLLPRARLPAPLLSEDERASIRAGYHNPRSSSTTSGQPYHHHHSMNREWAQRQEQQSYFRQPNPDYARSNRFYH